MERGWDIYRIYCDEDYSGADSMRPDFLEMLRAARERKFQIILCKTQSRFTRDMELVEKYIHGLFPVWGIRFIAVADNADTDVRGNKKARQINGLMNEWYLEDLSDNIRMVFDHKRRQGQYIGGFPIYGYRKHPADKNRLVIDPEPAAVVRQIYRWCLEGYGRQRIACMLNDRGVVSPARYREERGWGGGGPARSGCGLWNAVTVWRILHNEMYTGVMVQGRTRKVSYKSKAKVSVPEDQWYRVEGTHEAIIDRDTFHAVQRALALRARPGGSGEAHPLSGLVRCMDCGSTMSKGSAVRKSGERVFYLRCGLYAGSGGEKRCTRHGIRLDRLLEAVAERVRLYIGQSHALDGLVLPKHGDTGKEAEALERERKAVAARMEKHTLALKSLYLDKVSGVLREDQFVALNRSFSEEKARMERRLAEIGRELEEYSRPRDREADMARAGELLRMEVVPRELAAALIERLEIGERDPFTGEQRVRIHWRF